MDSQRQLQMNEIGLDATVSVKTKKRDGKKFSKFHKHNQDNGFGKFGIHVYIVKIDMSSPYVRLLINFNNVRIMQ